MTSCLAVSSLLNTAAATTGRAAVTGVCPSVCLGRMAGALSPIEGGRAERPADRPTRVHRASMRSMSEMSRPKCLSASVGVLTEEHIRAKNV